MVLLALAVLVTCPDCKGEGGFRWMEGHPDGENTERGERCARCGGSGTVDSIDA